MAYLASMEIEKKTLQLVWIRRVERIDGEMLPVYEGTNEKGQSVRIHVKQHQLIDEEVSDNDVDKL